MYNGAVVPVNKRKKFERRRKTEEIQKATARMHPAALTATRQRAPPPPPPRRMPAAAPGPPWASQGTPLNKKEGKRKKPKEEDKI